MKTRFFLTVMLLCISYNIAQASVGVKIGGNYTYFKNNDIQAEPALTYGITSNIKLTRRTALSLEFLINRKNGNINNISRLNRHNDPWSVLYKDLHISTIFFEIPIFFKINFYTNDKFAINIYSGPSLSIGLWDRSTSTALKVEYLSTESENDSYDYYVALDQEGLSSAGTNWNIGVEFVWRRYSLELRCSKSNFDLEMIDDMLFYEKFSHSIYLMGGIHF